MVSARSIIQALSSSLPSASSSKIPFSASSVFPPFFLSEELKIPSHLNNRNRLRRQHSHDSNVDDFLYHLIWTFQLVPALTFDSFMIKLIDANKKIIPKTAHTPSSNRMPEYAFVLQTRFPLLPLLFYYNADDHLLSRNIGKHGAQNHCEDATIVTNYKIV